MRVVLDTNLLVSAFLTPSGAPAQVIQLALNGKLSALYDERIFAEYLEVLARPRFKLDPTKATNTLGLLRLRGEHVTTHPLNIALPDVDDLPFLEVAVSGKADALVTGNIRHFPDTRGILLLSPRQLLDLFASKEPPR